MVLASAPLLHPHRHPSCASEKTLLLRQGIRQHPPFRCHTMHTFHGHHTQAPMKGKGISQPVTFEPGVHYVLQGVGYQVVLLLDDGRLVARNLTTNAHITHRLSELWQQWQENTLAFARWGPNFRERTVTPLKTTYTFADLADLPPTLQDITWHRYQLIRPLLHVSSHQRTKQVVEARIRTYLSTLEQEKTLGEETWS